MPVNITPYHTLWSIYRTSLPTGARPTHTPASLRDVPHITELLRWPADRLRATAPPLFALDDFTLRRQVRCWIASLCSDDNVALPWPEIEMPTPDELTTQRGPAPCEQRWMGARPWHDACGPHGGLRRWG